MRKPAKLGRILLKGYLGYHGKGTTGRDPAHGQKRRWYFPFGPSLEKEVKAGGGVTAGIWKVCSLLLFK